MAQDNYARDEAGNVWQVDAQGNAVRLVQQAGQQAQPTVVAPPDWRVRQQQAQQQRDANADARAANADARAAVTAVREQAKADRDAREWEATHNPDGTPKATATAAQTGELRDRLNRVRQLANQIDRVQELYEAGPDRTKGLSGVWDYLPTDANSRFDTAGAQLSQMGLAAFRVPGTGTVSDRDAIMFDRANLPSASTRDAAIEEQLRGMRARVDEEFRSLGQKSPSWKVGGKQYNWDNQSSSLVPASGNGGSAGGGGGTPPGGGMPTNGGGNPQAPSGGNALGSAPIAPAPAGYELRFNDQGVPVTGYRLNPQQEAEIADAIRVGDRGQALALLQRYSGNAPTESTIRSVESAIETSRRGGNVNFNYGDVDAAAQSQADIERYGGQLPRAMQERSQAPGFDTSVRQGVNGLTAGLADRFAALGNTAFGGGSYEDNLKLEQARTEADNRLRPTNSTLSNIVGGAAGALATEGAATALLPARAAAWAPRIGDAVYGGVSGYTSAAPGQEMTGAGIGAVAGLGGGAAGRGIARGAANVIGGARNAAVDYLRERGVPLTVGQLVGQGGRLGRAIKALEDASTSIPGVGDLVNARRSEGFEAFNRAAFDEGLAPIGATTGGVTGAQGVDAARAARSAAYRDALSPVDLTPDAQFGTEIAAARQSANQLPADMAARGNYALDRAAENTAPTGNISGAGFQQSLRRFRRAASDNASLPNGADLGDVMGAAEGAYSGLLSRQAPNALDAFNAANAANRNVSVLQGAVNRARNGGRSGEVEVFTPSQLMDESAANARRFGGGQGTTRRPFYDLATAGQRVLPSSLPDSGTARRITSVTAPAALAGIGGAGGYAAGDTQTGVGTSLGLGALLALGATRNGQRALTALIAERPDALRRVGEQLNRRARIGGIFGAPLVLEATR